MREVEVKVELMAPGALRDRLHRLGAVRHRSARRQLDVFFQHPVRDFAAGDEALRVRHEEDGWRLTYKGPRATGSTKRRDEHEVGCEEDPTPVLAALGFRANARLVKQRESWRYRDVDVSIDEVEGLGAFAEVEVMADDADVERAVAKVEQVLKELALEGAERYAASYIEMALACGAAGAQAL